MFNVILIEPKIPPNTGNIIRLCANTGAKLHLVKPLGFRMDAKKLQRAGLDYHDLAQVHVHDDLDACLRALDGGRIYLVETGGTTLYSAAQFQSGDTLMFGSETQGLSEAVKARFPRERWLAIPMANDTRSLNLSNSVAVVLYEAWRQLKFAPSPPS